MSFKTVFAVMKGDYPMHGVECLFESKEGAIDYLEKTLKLQRSRWSSKDKKFVPDSASTTWLHPAWDCRTASMSMREIQESTLYP